MENNTHAHTALPTGDERRGETFHKIELLTSCCCTCEKFVGIVTVFTQNIVTINI